MINKKQRGRLVFKGRKTIKSLTFVDLLGEDLTLRVILEISTPHIFSFQFSFWIRNENFFVGPTTVFTSICNHFWFHSCNQTGGNGFHVLFSLSQMHSFMFSSNPHTALVGLTHFN